MADAPNLSHVRGGEGPVDGVFLGADFAGPASRHVVSLGAMRGVRFMACFRFKMWWMAQRMGDKGDDVPHETQFLLVESKAAAGRDQIISSCYLLPEAAVHDWLTSKRPAGRTESNRSFLQLFFTYLFLAGISFVSADG
ncbi:hypothetical protein QYE76_049048 [Lolium multiflorum]|uniref:Uncharacterized protein n=1 Tax=Lolium multiflorum TaxID=4521 RepID=A0AAD8SNH7_LOLMU|nr:hypothetical protein QYE76_049048 [Lolium multiflorum]